MADIENARKIINRVDREMAKLFEERMMAVQEVAQYKKERGLMIEDGAREREVIARNEVYVEDEKIRAHYVNFQQSVMDISKTYQRGLLHGAKVAYSGVPGAFAEITAKKLFPDYEPVSYPDFAAAYEACEKGECDIALLPVENSFNGDVGQVMDLAFFGSLYINGVYGEEIEHNLVANEGASLDSVKTVISHPQALGQCAEFLKKRGYEIKEAVNTAVAAKLVADSKRTDIAAIASDEAAENYSLIKLAEHINQSAGNCTRFAVFSRTRVMMTDL